jgi:signal transduction histidine kinase
MVDNLEKITVSRDKLAEEIEVRKKIALELEVAYTQLKAAQEYLAQSEKFKAISILASGVAHEVKNPLAIIQLGIECLEKKSSLGDSELALITGAIKEAIFRADTIVRGLMDFSSIAEPHRQVCDLSALIEGMLLLMKNSFDKNHINVAKDIQAQLPGVDIDKGRIEQVLINIFGNAIEAMPKGGRITVRAYSKKLAEAGLDISRRGDDIFRIGETVVMVEISDTGKGISKDIAPRLFGHFSLHGAARAGQGWG